MPQVKKVDDYFRVRKKCDEFSNKRKLVDSSRDKLVKSEKCSYRIDVGKRPKSDDAIHTASVSEVASHHLETREEIRSDDDSAATDEFMVVAHATETTPKRKIHERETVCPRKRPRTAIHKSGGETCGRSQLLLAPQTELPVVKTIPQQQPRPSSARKLELANEPLDLAEIHGPRQKSGKLTELQARLSKLNDCKIKLAKLNETRQLRKVDAIEVLDPKSSTEVTSRPKKELTERPAKAPAYQRFHNLASDQSSLVLPYKYKVMSECFRCADTVLSIMCNRKEQCTFPKIKASVQEMIRKSFEERHIAQIMTVFPKAYNITYEKQDGRFQGCRDSGYLLTLAFPAEEIEIEHTDAINNKTMMDSPAVTNSRENNVNSVPQNAIQIAPSMLLTRRSIFHKRLLDITKMHHHKFLISLNLAIDIPEDKLVRWHPNFHVDEVPDIELATLPEPPNQIKYTTAKDVLGEVKDCYGERINRALKDVSVKFGAMEVSVDNKRSITPEVNKSVKGIPVDLLKKIREREAMKCKLEMTRDIKQDHRIAVLHRLPEIARILRSYFIIEKKTAIVMEDAVTRLIESYKSAVSRGEMEEHLRLFEELVPEWLKLIYIRNASYLKIDKQIDINDVVSKLEKCYRDALEVQL